MSETIKETNNNNEKSNLTWKHRISYAAGDAGGVVTLIMAQTYLNRYATNIVGVSFETLSILLLVWNVWDAINDPLLGNIIDKVFEGKDAKKDKFRPWILASIPVITIGLIALFSVPSRFDGLTAVVLLFVTKIIYEAGYTMINIAMGSIQGVMAVNDTERATLSSFRGLGSNFGALLGSLALGRLGDKIDKIGAIRKSIGFMGIGLIITGLLPPIINLSILISLVTFFIKSISKLIILYI